MSKKCSSKNVQDGREYLCKSIRIKDSITTFLYKYK